MQLDLHYLDKVDNVDKIDVPDHLFGVEKVNDVVIAQVIRWQTLKRRQKSVVRKTRSDVSGSGRKIYRQKGTGNARHSARYVSQFRGGGVVHGPVGVKAKVSVPKKVKRLALRNALSLLSKHGKISIIDVLNIDKVSTKEMSERFSAFKGKSVLFVGEASYKDNNFYKSIRNLDFIHYLSVDGLNVIDLLKYQYVFISQKSLSLIENRL